MCTIVVLFHIVYCHLRIQLNDFNHLISMSTPRHENERDVTKIKAAYPGYMWGLAYYSHVERTFQTASYYWGGGRVVVSINSFIKTTTLYWNPCTKRACICVLGVSILHLCTIFLLDFGTVPTAWYLFFLLW